MAAGTSYPCLHTSKRMHFIEDLSNGIMGVLVRSCIRQNVCTSLRNAAMCAANDVERLHTSKRMHFIEEQKMKATIVIYKYLHTSKRMHFIEDRANDHCPNTGESLHTSKRMHFIEDSSSVSNTSTPIALAYVKTYALH